MTYKNLEFKKVGKVLKKAKTGFEIETHLIDNNGNLSHSAEKIIKSVRRKNPQLDIVKECSRSLLEFGCFPDDQEINPALEILDSVEKKFLELINLLWQQRLLASITTISCQEEFLTIKKEILWYLLTVNSNKVC